MSEQVSRTAFRVEGMVHLHKKLLPPLIPQPLPACQQPSTSNHWITCELNCRLQPAAINQQPLDYRSLQSETFRIQDHWRVRTFNYQWQTATIQLFADTCCANPGGNAFVMCDRQPTNCTISFSLCSVPMSFSVTRLIPYA